jgi:hypothetical protein
MREIVKDLDNGGNNEKAIEHSRALVEALVKNEDPATWTSETHGVNVFMSFLLCAK